jgi:hypothetical protein
MITIAVNKKELEPIMREVTKLGGRPRQAMAGGQRSASNFIRSWMRDHNSNPVNHFGKRTNFWLQVMRSVQAPPPPASGTPALIAINDPRFAQKLYGGPIVAKRAKALTIPVSPEAYGRTAAVLEQEKGIKLFAISTKGGGGMLVQSILKRAGRSKGGQTPVHGGLIVHYLLRKSVYQQPDPLALPPIPSILESFIAGAKAVVQTLINRLNTK